jgi:hypothetical protein
MESGNPFRSYSVIEPADRTIALPGDQTASRWLLGQAVSEIENALKRFEVGFLTARVHQRGEQYVATGVDLPELQRRINETLSEFGVEPFDRVGFCLGLSLKSDGDFQLGEARARGIYVGVRIQRARPNGTVRQEVHDAIFDECEPALTRTGKTGWSRREHSDFWSIWRFVGPDKATSSSASKTNYLDVFLNGLAALEGIGWRRPTPT